MESLLGDTIKQKLATGIWNAKKIEFSIYEINTAFGSLCSSGRNRLNEMKKEYQKYLINTYQNQSLAFKRLDGYRFDPKTRKYHLDAGFIMWMYEKYIKKDNGQG